MNELKEENTKTWKWWCKVCGVLVSVHCNLCEKCADEREARFELESELDA